MSVSEYVSVVSERELHASVVSECDPCVCGVSERLRASAASMCVHVVFIMCVCVCVHVCLCSYPFIYGMT